MDRAKILTLIDAVNSRGLEIGAQTKPVVTREMGRVEYVDRASTEELRRWYAIDPSVDSGKLVEVDHVWGTQTLFECVGNQRNYDYVVASHVLEHVPDLLGWLEEIAAVLVDGGIASFVIPDKRYTFDVLRQPSTPAQLVDAYLRKLRWPDLRQIFDHFDGYRDVSQEAIRNGSSRAAEMPPVQTRRALLATCRHVLVHQTYMDAHCWVFTPASFIDMLDFASDLGLLPFEIATVFPTAADADEFFVSLRRLPDSTEQVERRAAFVRSRQRITLPCESDDVLALAARLHEAEQRLAAIHESTSWHITAPLRRAVDAWRRLLRSNPAN